MTDDEIGNSFILSLKRKVYSRGSSIAISIGIFLVVLSVLGYLIYRQREILLSFEWHINWIYLLPILGVHGVAILCGALAWGNIMNSLGPNVRFFTHLRLFCINMVTRRIPGAFWFVLYRGKVYSKYGYSFKITSLASGVELAVSLISGVLSASVFGIQTIRESSLPVWVFIIPMLLSFAFLHPKLLKWLIAKFGSDPLKFSYKTLIGVIGLYILMWIFGGIILYLLANMVYYLPISTLGYLISIWAIVGVITYSLVLLPSNFGVTEVSLSLFLASLMPSPIAVILSIAMRIVLTVLEGFWAILYSLVRDKQ